MKALKITIDTTTWAVEMVLRLCLQFVVALLKAKPEVMVTDAISVCMMLCLILLSWLDFAIGTINLVKAKLFGYSDEYQQQYDAHLAYLEARIERFKPATPTWKRVWKCPNMKGYF